MVGICPNFSLPDGSFPPTKMLEMPERIAAITLYTVIMALSLGGNSIVLFSIFYFNRLRRMPTNMFIANLAVADILMAAFSVPFGYWEILVLQYWPFGPILCPTIYFIQCLAVMLSSHTLILICVDRFCAIMLTFTYKLRHNTALKALLCVWSIDVIIALPIAIVQRTVKMENSTQYTCSETWNSEFGAYLYSQVALFLQYFLPLLVFLTTYTGIGLKLWYAQLPSSDSQYQTKTTKQRRDNTMKKLIIMMLMLCLVYTLCWLPPNMLNIAVSRCPQAVYYPYILYVWWGCHLVAMSHTFVNPVVYVITNKRFREAFKFVLHTICKPFGIHFPYNAANLMDDAMVKYVFSNIHSHAGDADSIAENKIYRNGRILVCSDTSKDPLLRGDCSSPCNILSSKSYDTFRSKTSSPTSSNQSNKKRNVVTFKTGHEHSKAAYI